MATPRTYELTTQSPQARDPRRLTERWSPKPSVALWLNRLQQRAQEWKDIEGVLRAADTGQLDIQGDLYTKMLTADAFIASVYRTYTATIGGARRVVTAREPDNDVAVAQATLCDRLLEELPNVDRLVSQMADADWCGYAVAELIWERRGRWVVPISVDWLDRSRFRMSQGFELYLWDRGTAAARARELGLTFTAIDDEGREMGTMPHEAARLGIALVANKYMVHQPRILATYSQAAGLFRAIVRSWFVKRWALTYELDGAELAGNPRVALSLPADDGANAELRAQALQDLACLAADSVAVMSGGTTLTVVQPGSMAGNVWSDLIDRCNDDIAQAAFGSTLNVTVGDTGGNRALGESQRATTIAPRMRSSAAMIADLFEQQLFRPYLSMNRHLFGGAVYVPRLEIVLSEAEPLLDPTQLANVQALLVAVTARTMAPEAADAMIEAAYPAITGAHRKRMVDAAAAMPPPAMPGAAPLGGAAAASPLASGDVTSPIVVASPTITARPSPAADVSITNRDALARGAAKEAAPAWGRVHAGLAAAIGRATGPEDARSQISRWAADPKMRSAIADSLVTPLLAANAAGRARVVTVDAPNARPRALARRVALDIGTPSFSVAPDDAIAAFLELGIVTPAQYEAMQADARQRSFTAADLATEALITRAHAALTSALASGSTLADFQRDVRSGAISLGVTPADPSYLETVFRTNIATAYTSGRVAEMDAPEVQDAYPYVQLVAIIDGRTTSICQYLDGLTFDRMQDPGYGRFLPPNHYNCRTDFVLVGADELDRARLIRSDQVESRGQPQPPFDYDKATQ